MRKTRIQKNFFTREEKRREMVKISRREGNKKQDNSKVVLENFGI